MSQKLTPFEFGISFSGGGARGILHIGVLEALEQHGIFPQIISGTSMGALVGVFYAAGMKPQQILELVKSNKLLRMINWKLPTSGLLDLKKINEVLGKYIPEDNFEALKKPFCCTVTNLNLGLTETKDSGKLFQWVLASASIPVIFEPQVIDGQTYVDGGMLNNLPAHCIRNRCRFLIGVHANHNGPEENIEGFRQIAERTFRLVFAKNVNESFALCDFTIDPADTRLFNTFDFEKADQIYKLGYDETIREMPRLLETIGKAREPARD